MEFCSPFDEALAHQGPPGVFLRDHKDTWRFVADWTRDAWGRAPGPHEHGWRFLLMRDHATRFVTLALVTSPTLIEEHPRADVRAYATLEEAEAARAELGAVPVAEGDW